MKLNAPVDILVDELPAPRRSLRLAVVTETYPPEVNGVALTVARMVEGLRARNHGVQLVRLRQGRAGSASAMSDDDEVLLRGMQIPRYPNLRMGVPSTSALVSLWSHRRPDVVHIATEGPLGWSALRAATRLKLPAVSDFRTNFHSYSQHYGIGWLHRPIVAYLRKFHNRTRRTMVPTPALRVELERLGFDRLTVVPRGVDTQRFHPSRRCEVLRATWGAGARTLVVMCVARLAPEKNLGTLAEAFEAIRAGGIDARLVLVGDGPLRAELQARCGDAVFAGMRSGEDLAAHYASADMFVFPSLTETFGNVTLEAMASGLPVLAFDHAAAGQLILHGRNGLLARVDDRAEFIHLAAELAADPTRGRIMGEHARVTAQRMDWDHVIDEIEAVLVEALLDTSKESYHLALRPIAG